MRTALIALLLTFASQVNAGCGNLCDFVWWENPFSTDLETEIAAGADVMGRGKDSSTPLHWAASYGASSDIQILLKAGADVLARDDWGGTPLIWASTNEDLSLIHI